MGHEVILSVKRLHGLQSGSVCKSICCVNIKTWVEIPSTHIKSWPCLYVTIAPVSEGGTKWILEAYWPGSLAKTISLWFSERPCLSQENKTESDRGVCQYPLLASTTVHLHTECIHKIHSCIHTQNKTLPYTWTFLNVYITLVDESLLE